MYLIDPSNLPNSENSRFSRKQRVESKQIRIFGRESGVAWILDFLSPNPQTGRRFRRPSKPAKPTVFKILAETNMNSKPTKSTKNDTGPNQINSIFLEREMIQISVPAINFYIIDKPTDKI